MCALVDRCDATVAAGYIDDFNDGALHGWKVGQSGGFPNISMNNGIGGAGDHSLFMATSGAGGEQSRLLVINDTAANNGNWEGNWTAAGVSQIELDVLNPNTFPLQMRIGIAGPGGVFGGGGGDTYVSDAISVAATPNVWQHIVFPARAVNFHPFGGTPEDLSAALAAVTHFRILHNQEQDFAGEFLAGQFYLDNIRLVVPEPASWLFMTGLFVFSWVLVRRRV